MPPAARLGDNHACPRGGGVILPPCSIDVIINGLPAARVGDLATDPQGPDAIAQGEPTVFINGRLASRLTDKTASGGVIVQGSPNVIIGMDFSGHCMKEAAQNGTALVRGVNT